MDAEARGVRTLVSDGRRKRRAPGELLEFIRQGARAYFDECLIFPTPGYTPSVRYKGVRMKATRAVWMEATGNDPGELVVMLICDRPQCINIRHLRVGNRADVAQVMAENDKLPKGERNGRAVLTAAQVGEIRELLGQEVPVSRIAAQFDVGTIAVREIANGKTWT